MDVSVLFKAVVKTVSLRDSNSEMVTSGRIFPKKTTKKSAFLSKAQVVVTQISTLRQFLLENRPAYLNFTNYLSGRPRMSDADRDKIDAGAQKIMSTCSQLIKDLKREVADLDVSQQYLEHREIMLLLIEGYLKNVCKIYSEQKAIRVKHAIEMRKMSKLELDGSSRTSLSPSDAESCSTDAKASREEKEAGVSNDSSPLKIQELNGDVAAASYEEELSAEDIQTFELENEQLYNELNMITEEVKQIESKVVHIAELQEIFTEKVLDQDKDLDRLTTTVIGSTENVKAANEEIRRAIQRNAGLRVWILFFLLVMSFSLLFLDWYNP